jgi:hypothetical protein
MAKRKYHGQCPLCGREATLTRDHVPPDGIFLPPKPNNLITVRTCRSCNEGSKLDDEYFRICAAVSWSPSEAQWRLWNEKVMGSLQRSPKLNAMLVHMMDAVQEEHKRKPLRFSDGTELTAEQAALTLPLLKSRIDATIEKIVRCLYYAESGSVLSQDLSFDISMEHAGETRYQTCLANPRLVVGTHREFVYYFDRLSPAPESSWLLWFYERQLFRATLTPSQPGLHIAAQSATRAS